MNLLRRAARTGTLFLAICILFSSCVSSTYIQSVPSGAKLYIDNEPVGTTPYHHSDTKIVSSSTTVRLEKEGYEPLHGAFSKDEELNVGALVGGIFLVIPFLWIMKYKPTRTYELKPLAGIQPVAPALPQPVQDTKAERLREYKKLYDEKVLTKEEYEREKKRILEEK